jgi:tetratricopeptide (TPR) repeat protein
MSHRTIVLLIQGLVFWGCVQSGCTALFAEEHCGNPVGTLVSVQGEAQIRRAEQKIWLPATLDASFCAGDVLRVGSGSRAAVVLVNESILRVDQNTTLNFGEPEQGVSLLELLKGMLHIFSHRPRSLQVATPYVNGYVEGTEFLVQVDERQSVIIVFEGLVSASNPYGRVELVSGQSAAALAGAAPVYTAVVTPRDAVQWTLYYPVILDANQAPGEDQQAILLSQASEHLTVGGIKEAREALAKAMELNPNNGEALALLSIIEVVQNHNEQALTLAEKALEYAPDSAAAGLALSYARQAMFDLAGALNILEHTAEANPGNGLVKARLAELQLAAGRLDKALAAIQEATGIDPGIARTQAVLGFVHLTRVELEAAENAFNHAIRLDQALPLARLGLGLTHIRKGELGRGRGEIEVAAALDPGNALIRSYLGKAYFEERRDSQASRQFEIAKELDAADPTPWFYDAIRKQTINQPVAALYDLQKSIALNNNRAVYRSSFLLDDDLAARSASLGRIYADLGFQQLALAEGWKSVSVQPGNFSAHRFLADSYRVLPRHEIARVSELLKSQLLQPLNINPVQPQLGRSDLGAMDGAGPGRASLNEYNSLFLRNRFALQAGGVAGSNETLGDELIHSAVHNRLSYSIGQYYYQTDGIRENNDQRYEIYNGYAQGMVSPKTSWMFELRYDEDEIGDLTMVIDPAVYDYDPTIRQTSMSNSARAGFRHDFLPHSTMVGTVALVSADDDVTGWEGLDIFLEGEGIIGELQHLYSSDRFSLQSGAGYFYSEEKERLVFAEPFPMESADEFEDKHANLYSYAQIELPHRVIATVGLSGDLVETSVKDREELNPKLGITWQPADATLIRGAVFKTIRRGLVNSQTIEPTQVAGFNQFFNDDQAALAWTYGIGLDQKFSETLFGGAQYFFRDIDSPWLNIDIDSGMPIPAEDEWQENIGSAYLYWAPVKWMSLGLEYFYEDFDHDELDVGAIFGVKGVTNHRLSPQINFFHYSGFSARILANYIDQKREFREYVPEDAVNSDQFWQVDLAISYRLPQRYGIVSFGVTNLFNEEFNYIDTDPANPRFLSEQQLMLSLTIIL